MLWNAKTIDEDGTTLPQNAYIYRYDDFGQMTGVYYAADDPAFPGEYNQDVGRFNETVDYDLGGNMHALGRNGVYRQQGNELTMDSLKYTYSNAGNKPKKIEDLRYRTFDASLKHFVDGTTQTTEYTYDASGRTLTDKNRNVTFIYNRLGLPSRILQTGTNYSMRFTYDAAGNKLQKEVLSPLCDPGETSPCVAITYDYIGNFVYKNGKLQMIYHPEGVIHPTPANASNTTDYVYDYFIKDYLGNVRAVITEENATYTKKFLATMEMVYRQIEEANFDNINETDADLPLGYPVDGSVELNEKIALLSTTNGTEIGPSMVLPVRRGDRVSLSTNYFYTEDAEGATYDNFNLLVNEVLIALAASAAGVLNLSEAQLIDIATGGGNYNQAITDFMSANFDTTDVQRPHAYLVWILYDNSMKLVPEGSGAIRVTDPNELRIILQNDIPIVEDGYLHAYVTNGSAKSMSFDNMQVLYLRGNTRQINHYYPYGLSISGLSGDYDEYLNKYTSKELQTGEFDPNLSSGLEMFDFHARFYDPQLGRWFTPDPAEQFHNPYLAMGNNPVMYVDPDGKLVWFVPVIIGAVVGATSGGVIAHNNGQDWWKGAIAGGIIGAGIGLGVSAGLAGTSVNITGLGGVGVNGAGTFAQVGASSLGWNVTSNALITANINMASTVLQGGDLDATYKSGLVGLAAGAIGGAAGGLNMEGAGRASHFGLKASKTQNLVTNVLNGAGDRYVKGIDAGLSNKQALQNSFWGGVEGLISASLVNKSNYLDGIGIENVGLDAPGLNRFNGYVNHQFFRYASSGISSVITSTPGAGFYLGREFLSIYAPWRLDPIALMPGAFLNTGNFGLFPALQRLLAGDDYPYASPFLTPFQGR